MNVFEMTIQRKNADRWPIVVKYSRSQELLPQRSEGLLQLTPETLQELTRLQKRPRDYGRTLGAALFQDEIRDAFVGALYESEDPLRVLLFIEATDLEVRTLRWERLCAPIDDTWRLLATNQRVLLSLYIPAITERRFPPIGNRDLRALVLVASPDSLDRYRLAPFDVQNAVDGVRQALGEIPCDVLAHLPGAVGLPTLDALCEQLTKRETRYSLLHFVCHGKAIAGGETVLFWANAQNQVEPVTATRLLQRLADLNGPKGLPHFTFLCSCETASPDAEAGLGGLGQRLVRELGMPAAIAMSDPVTVKTALALTGSFYQQLRQSGQVDLALCEATAGLAERDDITVPALFSRLGGRPLFSDNLDRDLTCAEIEYGLNRLQTLLQERSPVLISQFKAQKARLEQTLGAEAAVLNLQGRQERNQGLSEINTLCDRTVELSFNALALGKTPPLYDSRCPFRGLNAFRPEDGEFFFGRELLIQKLQNKLAEDNFLAVLGPSGSGKSSVVLAGLIPSLQMQQKGLQMAYMTPSTEPLVQLETTLSKVQDRPSVLVVDQFEELFTLCSNNSDRLEFIDRLLSLTQKQPVVVTMRADFWGEVAPYPQLKERMQQRQELIGPMDLTELRRSMEMQAEKVGLRFEADLSNSILDEVRGEPGAMPLLQHLLLELWKRRQGRWLRCEEYRELGGVSQAIAQTADRVYHSLSPIAQTQVRNIFVRLTRLDDSAVAGEKRLDTRRRVTLEELVPGGGTFRDTKKLVQRLAGEEARLVVTTVNPATQKEQVEVAHEALIRYWPRLNNWLDEDRVYLQLRESIRQAALDWSRHGRSITDDSYLLHRGGRLEDAEQLRDRSLLPLNQIEQDYLEACIYWRDRQIQEKEARNLVFVVQDLLNNDLTKALRMAQTAYSLDCAHNLPQVSQALSEAYYTMIAKRVGLYRANLQQNAPVSLAIYAPDGSKILTVPQEDNTAKLWDSRGQLLKELDQGSPIRNAAFSHDGSKIITVGDERRVKLWDSEGNYIKDLIGHTKAPNQPWTNVNHVAFSPDDQTIVTVSSDYSAIIWDGNGNLYKKLTDHRDVVGSVSFSPNGEYFVTCGLWRDSSARLYDKQGQAIATLGMDTGTHKKQHSWECGITSAAFSPDSQWLVTTSKDFTAKIWDIQGNLLKILDDHRGDVNQVVFSPDGNFFVTASQDKTAIIWDRQGNKRQVLTHQDSIQSVAFSPNGQFIVTGSADSRAKLWDLQGNLLLNFEGHESGINSVQFSPDGHSLLTASVDRTAKIWNIQSPINSPSFCHEQNVISAKFTPDGRQILTASYDMTVKLWDAQTHQLLKTYTGFGPDYYGNQRIYSLDISPDGKRFVTTGTDYTIRIWEIETGQIIKAWTGEHQRNCTSDGWCGATNARYSHDGNYIITCDFGGQAKVWDADGNFVKNLNESDPTKSHQQQVNGIDMSRDNQYIATGSYDKTVRLWNFETGQLIKVLSGHSKAVNCVKFAPDSQTLLTASADQTAKLWDLEGKILVDIKGHADNVYSGDFSETGDYLVTASQDKTAKIWDKKGKLIYTLTGHTEGVNSAYFSPDGQSVITASQDKSARIWPLLDQIYSGLQEMDLYCLTPEDLEEYGIDVGLCQSRIKGGD
jgi:WD40 repeat protein/energy-coupling factor transporter ATP-binding protein EcfA2